MNRWKIKWANKAVIVLVAIGVLGLGVMLLWNWVMPTLFAGAHAIDYGHALGLLLLSRLLFGGFRGHGGGRLRHWRRWQAMTPEEREKLHAAWHARRHAPTGE